MNRIMLIAALLSVSVQAAQRFQIVLPAEPSRRETFAAAELKHHLAKAQDGEIGIAREGETPPSVMRCLFVGHTVAAKRAGLDDDSWKDEEHLVAGVGGNLYFIGGDRDMTKGGEPIGSTSGKVCCGTLYAVYDFLEREMGVAWIWPGEVGEFVPRREVPMCEGLRRRGREPLELRKFGGEPDTEKIPAGGSMYGWADIANARRDVEARRLWLIRHRIGARRKFNGSHAFTDWWKRYGKDHPEYFNLLTNGRREPLAGDEDGRNVTLCVSNLDLHRRIVANWLKSGASRTQPYYTACVNACENDTPGMCTCAKCRAWDAEDPRFSENPYWRGDKDYPLKKEGRFVQLADVQWGETASMKVLTSQPQLSDRYLKFYNAVLAEARRFRPEAEVYGYAYANYMSAPKETRVSEGVIISFVPRMFFPYTQSESDYFRRQWMGWRSAGARQMIYRPNYMLAGANLPYNTAPQIAADIAFAATNGMMAINQDSLIGAWSAHAIQNYTLTRLMREPTAGYEKALGEFAEAFGPAAQEIREYCAHLARVGEGLSVEDWQELGHRNRGARGLVGGGFKNFVLVAADVYSEEWFAKAGEILDRAEVKTRKADSPRSGNTPSCREMSSRRVDFLKKGLEDARLTYLTRVAQKSGNKDAFAAAMKRMDDYRASVEADGVCSYYWTATREMSGAGWWHKYR